MTIKKIEILNTRHKEHTLDKVLPLFMGPLVPGPVGGPLVPGPGGLVPGPWGSPSPRTGGGPSLVPGLWGVP